MATSYGKNIRLSVYGESHAPEIGVRVCGLPEGLRFSMDELLSFMSRRAPGNNEFSTPRKEADTPIFYSGIHECADGCFELDGSELHAIIKNTSMRSADYGNTQFVPRPSHADFAARAKYGENVDLRGGGHFSGRLTAPMCIVGGICLQYLRSLGIDISAHIYSVGDIYDTPFDLVNVGENEFSALRAASDFPVLDTAAGERMKSLISSARADGDSVGGIVEVAAIGLRAGLGEHIFDGIENRISSAIFGIPAVKGIEFGLGFACSALRGSQNNDAFITDGTSIRTRTNNCGGILGGMSDGMPIVFRSPIKPTPSIFKEQDSVDMVSMTPAKLQIHGRHDPCIVLRAVPVFEAVTAIALTDIILDK